MVYSLRKQKFTPYPSASQSNSLVLCLLASNLNMETHEEARSSGCAPGEDPCPEELEALESDVKQMAEKILKYRETLPHQLKTTLASVLAAQRPHVPEASDPGPSPDFAERDVLIEAKLSAPEDPETAMKVRLLKEKISSNAAAMPDVLKRMKDCIARVEKLDSYNVIIRPAFKRKRTR